MCGTMDIKCYTVSIQKCSVDVSPSDVGDTGSGQPLLQKNHNYKT